MTMIFAAWHYSIGGVTFMNLNLVIDLDDHVDF